MTSILTPATHRGRLLWFAIPMLALALLALPARPSHAGVLVGTNFGPFGAACGHYGPLYGAAYCGSPWACGYGYGYGLRGNHGHRPYRHWTGRHWRQPYRQHRAWTPRFHAHDGLRYEARRGFEGRQFDGGRRFEGPRRGAPMRGARRNRAL
jgi:hypothetical protein